MTIEQTVDISAGRRLTIDVPLEVPIGRTRVIIQFPALEPPNPYEAVERLAGLAKRMGLSLTVDRFLEMRREDVQKEEAEYRCIFGKDGAE